MNNLKIIFLVSASLSTSLASAGDKEAPSQLLRLAAKHHKTMGSQIQVLEADYEIVEKARVKRPRLQLSTDTGKEKLRAIDDLFREGPILLEQKITASCIVDWKNDRLRSSFRQTDEVAYTKVDGASRLDVQPKFPYQVESVLTPEKFVWMDLRSGFGRPVLRTGSHIEGENRSMGSDVLDPRHFYCCFGWSIDELLILTADGHDRGTWAIVLDNKMNFDSAKNGEKWALRWNHGIEVFTINLQKHGEKLLLTKAHWDCSGGVAQAGHEWKYVNIAGTILPRKWTRYNLDESGRLVDSREVKMTNSELNNQLTDETFTLDSLNPE